MIGPARLDEIERICAQHGYVAAVTALELIAAAREAIALRALIEQHNAKLSRVCERQDTLCAGSEPGECIACPRRVYGIDLSLLLAPAQGGETQP